MTSPFEPTADLKMPKKLETDKTKIMVWTKKDSITGNAFIGIELPKTMPVQRRIELAYEIGAMNQIFKPDAITRFTRIFKGELALLIDPKIDECKPRMIYTDWLIKYFKIKIKA